MFLQPLQILAFIAGLFAHEAIGSSIFEGKQLQNNDAAQKPMVASPTHTYTPTVNELSPAAIKAQQQALMLAPSEADKQGILVPGLSAQNLTYQFVNKTVLSPTGGSIVLSAVDQFPALLGTHVGAAIGFFNPCGLNVPHSHPRASEFLTVVQGTLIAALVPEVAESSGAGNINGTNPVGSKKHIETTLSNYTGILFPQGTVHWQFNPTCEVAVFAAAFDNLDPGRTQIAANFFSSPDFVLRTALGSGEDILSAQDISKLRDHIPGAFNELVEECVARCKI